MDEIFENNSTSAWSVNIYVHYLLIRAKVNRCEKLSSFTLAKQFLKKTTPIACSPPVFYDYDSALTAAPRQSQNSLSCTSKMFLIGVLSIFIT